MRTVLVIRSYRDTGAAAPRECAIELSSEVELIRLLQPAHHR